MIVFNAVDAVGETKGGGNADLVLGLVLAVAALALGLPELRHGERLLARNFIDIVQNTVWVAVIRLNEFSVFLIAECERHARIDNSLPLKRILKVLLGNIDIGKDGQIRFPAENRAGCFAVGRLLFHLADEFALFKMQRVFKSVTANDRVKIFG